MVRKYSRMFDLITYNLLLLILDRCFVPFYSYPFWFDVTLIEMLMLYSGNSPLSRSHLECNLHPSSLLSLSLCHSTLCNHLHELWGFILLKKVLWLRVRYESTTEIHLFFLFSITLFWLVACRVHRNFKRFDLIF